MKKIQLVTALLLAALLIAGCGTKSEEGSTGSEEKVSFENVYASVEDAMVEVLQETDDSLTKEELLSGFFIEDLVEQSDDNPTANIVLERMEIDQEQMANGKAVFAKMNVNADEIILLEAKTEDDVEALKTGLERELKAQVQTWERYLPDQYEKVKNNVIKTNGSYLLYVTSSNPEKIVQAFDNNFK